jgi:hypothetical protein
MALTEAEITSKLYLGDTFRSGDREVRVLFLLPERLGARSRCRGGKGRKRP